MLSYQHGFHAGNLADVHKHWALTWTLAYMTRKPKPLSYIETHGGRGLYDLDSDQAVKTGEASAGIEAMIGQVAATPYGDTIDACRAAHGPRAYPGSPWIASHLLRDADTLHIAELHPQENKALAQAVPKARVYQQDGFEMAQSLCPPTPRRGLLLVDPSYEVKADYATIPAQLAQIVRRWPVGIIMVWYPLLTDGRHAEMAQSLTSLAPDTLRHEVHFPPAREGHRMVGSGLIVVNPPWGLEDALKHIETQFAQS